MGLALLALVGCDASPPIHLNSTAGTGGLMLTLVAEPGYRINARLAPALELPDGRVIRFASPAVTADSSYFTAAPTAWLAGNGASPHGLLRAGVCEHGATICRVVALRL